jgi:hypothetical protein
MLGLELCETRQFRCSNVAQQHVNNLLLLREKLFRSFVRLREKLFRSFVRLRLILLRLFEVDIIKIVCTF